MSAFRLAFRVPKLCTKVSPATLRPFQPPSLISRTRNFHTFHYRPTAPSPPRHGPSSTLKPTATTTRTFRRLFTTEPAIPYQRPNRTTTIRKLTTAGLLFGGTLLAINLVFNTPSAVSQDPTNQALPTYERQYLNETFLYSGVGVGIIGLGAKALHSAGWSYRVMAMNPLLFIVGSLALSVGTMFAVHATPPENTVMKHTLWVGFNLAQSLVLAPTFFYSPALIARAALYTVGVMGSIAYVGATAKSDKYLYLGGPLLAGVAVVALSGLAPLVLPLGSRALVATEAISLYGGLAVFGGFTLYDVQKILHNARLAKRGAMRRDTVNESISLELDFLNIFIRILAILGNRGNDKRR